MPEISGVLYLRFITVPRLMETFLTGPLEERGRERGRGREHLAHGLGLSVHMAGHAPVLRCPTVLPTRARTRSLHGHNSPVLLFFWFLRNVCAVAGNVGRRLGHAWGPSVHLRARASPFPVANIINQLMQSRAGLTLHPEEPFYDQSPAHQTQPLQTWFLFFTQLCTGGCYWMTF